jgi:hypothetical protein
VTEEDFAWLLMFASRVGDTTDFGALRARRAPVATALADARRGQPLSDLRSSFKEHDVAGDDLAKLRSKVDGLRDAPLVVLGIALQRLLDPWPDPARVTSFLRASERLTGYTPLDPSLAQRHLVRLSMFPAGEKLPALLGALDAAPDAEIGVAVGSHVDVAHAVVFQWYTGTTWRETGAPAPPDDPLVHFGALFWRAARAHAPMVPGGYFGHWHYPPEP